MKSKEKDLVGKLDTMYKQMQNKTLPIDEITEFDTLKTDYDMLLEYKAKGAQIRARIESTEYNEKSNAFFIGKAKYEFDKKQLKCLILKVRVKLLTAI